MKADYMMEAGAKPLQAAVEDQPIPAWLDRQRYPFRSRYLDVQGNRVHYVDEGAGPVLLLLHGNPTWSFLYRDIIVGLRERFRCVALDYPGFGLSTAAPDYGYTPAEHAAVVEQFISTLDLSGITLMVQDWGGPMGYQNRNGKEP